MNYKNVDKQLHSLNYQKVNNTEETIITKNIV